MSPKAIGVIDDEPRIVELLTTFFEIKGYTVHGAYSGEEGLVMVQGTRPDALLLDLMLPDIGGFEVLERLRAQPDFATLPVVIISARIDPEAKTRADRAGANAYMTKPLNFPDLLAELERLTSQPSAQAAAGPDAAFWQRVIAAGYAIPEGHTVADLTPTLLGFLGSTDPALRDEIAYGVLARWIIEGGHYAPDALRAMIQQLTPNLRAGIDEQGTDSVYLRSFSALILAAIVYYDNHKQPFLTEAEVRALADQVVAYFADEQDVRGYIPGQGWAHSCAHTADLIDELGKHRHLGAAELRTLLDAIAAKVTQPTGTTYQHDEDDRMSTAALAILKRAELGQPAARQWLDSLGDLIRRKPRASIIDSPADYSAYLNTKNFLRSLYVRMASEEDLPPAMKALQPAVLDVLKTYSV